MMMMMMSVKLMFRAFSKKKGLKKVVEYVIPIRRQVDKKVGKKVVRS